MKEKFSADKQRYVTALVLIVAVGLVALADSFFLTWLFLGAAYMVATHESIKLFKIENNNIYFLVFVVWFVALFYPNPDDLSFLTLIVVTIVMLFYNQINFKLLYPFLYPVTPFLFILALYHDFGMGVLIWLVIVVVGSDAGAYFVGKSIGKRKFSPISPNKTIEGVIGGIVIASFFGTLYGLNFVGFWLSLFVSFCTSVAAVYGDLFESYLKREAGVKDSGNILPGHGGVLDRVDGYLFASVVMVILLRGLA
ncbi:MAG: phosphatidate cytidylyltransferase [Epsilonproteobacteria bacterium]|nr:phosphatidate cytidylyltransferase [Campylobacterota bacterium]